MSAADPRTDLGAVAVVGGDPLTWTITQTGVDLTQYGTTWVGELRRALGSPTEIAFTIDSTNAASGTLVLTLTGTQTASMVSGNSRETDWYFDLQATGGASSPDTLFKGTVSVYKGMI